MPRYGVQSRESFVSKRVPAMVVTAAVVVAALLPSASSAARPLKPTHLDFRRVQVAERDALMTLGLVISRGCAPSYLVCINDATDLEILAFSAKAYLERSIATKLRAGKCKTAMRKRAAAFNKHAIDVRKAKVAWHARNYVLAERRYETDFMNGGRFDASFVRYCS